MAENKRALGSSGCFGAGQMLLAGEPLCLIEGEECASGSSLHVGIVREVARSCHAYHGYVVEGLKFRHAEGLPGEMVA